VNGVVRVNWDSSVSSSIKTLFYLAFIIFSKNIYKILLYLVKLCIGFYKYSSSKKNLREKNLIISL
jgi:hypothetical protein